MAIQQSFIESTELSGNVEFTVQANGGRVTISFDGHPVSMQLSLTREDLFKMIPVMDLAAAYVKQVNKSSNK